MTASSLKHHLAGFDLRQVEQVVDEAAHAHGLLVDDARGFGVVFRLLQGAVDHGLREALDGRQRRLQLVRDVGQEVLAGCGASG